MTSYRYLGYGVTDSNGVAHLDHDKNDNPINGYTGTGAGEVDVLASLDNPIVDGSIVSETYNVWDYIFYDKGTLSDNNDWYDNNLPTTLFERLDDCTFLKYSLSKNRIQVIDNLTNESLIIEFKYHPCGTTTDDYFIFQFDDSQNAIQFNNISLSSSIADVKFEINADKMNIDVNGVRRTTDYQLRKSIANGFNFRFGLNSNSDGIKVSDIKVYPL